MTHAYKLMIFLFACIAVQVCSTSCESGKTEEQNDGDRDIVESEEEGEFCIDGTGGCEGTNAVICLKGRWQELEDCTDYDKICEKGLCVFASEDGDIEDDEFDSEDGDSSDSENNDNVNPYVESSAPLQGQEDVPLSLNNILINFSEAMDATKISPIQRAVSVSGYCGMALSFTAEIKAGGTQLKLTLNGNLHSGTTHHVTLNPEKWFDLAGNPLGEYTLSFSSEGEAPDWPCADGDADGDSPQNPYIETSIPGDGAMGVALDLNDIKIKFSTVMETYNYDLNTGISVNGDDSHQVPFEGSWILNDQWIKIDLLENLHADTDYTVNIAAGLESNSGSYPLGAASIWFSTSPPPVDGDVDSATDSDVDAVADSDSDSVPPSNILELDGVDFEMAFDAPYNPQQHPRSLEAHWDALSSEIVLQHRNVPYDRNLANMNADLTQTGWNIEVIQMAGVPLPSGTVYPFNVTIRIDGAAAFHGQWDISVYYDGALEPDEINLQVP